MLSSNPPGTLPPSMSVRRPKRAAYRPALSPAMPAAGNDDVECVVQGSPLARCERLYATPSRCEENERAFRFLLTMRVFDSRIGPCSAPADERTAPRSP